MVNIEDVILELRAALSDDESAMETLTQSRAIARLVDAKVDAATAELTVCIYAHSLASNDKMRDAIRDSAKCGLPVPEVAKTQADNLFNAIKEQRDITVAVEKDANAAASSRRKVHALEAILYGLAGYAHYLSAKERTT